MIHKKHAEITVNGVEEQMRGSLQEESGYREEIPSFVTPL